LDITVRDIEETDMIAYRAGTPGADLTAYLIRYPQDVAFGDEDAAVVFARYHTDDFVLSNDGLPLDKERLLAHVRPARRNAARVTVEVHDALVSADRVAARYTLAAVMRRGHTVVTDIHMFGEVAPDGRLRRVEQLTRDRSRPEPGPS
jgi:ketosteroid isomerase-like protein